MQDSSVQSYFRDRRQPSVALFLGLLLLATFPYAGSSQSLKPSVRQLLNDYCLDCHNPKKTKGKLDLKSILDLDVRDHRDTWKEVSWMLREREMPPKDEPELQRPTDSEYRAATTWLDQAIEIGRDLGSPQSPRSHIAMVEQHCLSCHNADENKGGFNLDAIHRDPIAHHPEIWEKVVTRLQARQMPPPDRARPTEAGYKSLLSSLTDALDAESLAHPQPGRVDTFRRLNRTEYQNAIRDLLAVEIDAASLLPQDQESHGFDNVTVGTLSPSLVDRYITAAQKISRLAIGSPSKRPDGYTYRIPPDYTQEKHVEGLPIGTRGGAVLNYTFPRDGEYEIEVLLSRDRNEHVEGLSGSHEMEILIDRALVEAFTVTRKGHESHSEVDKHLKTRTFVHAGPRNLGVTFRQKSYSLLENKRQPFEAHFNLFRHPRLSPAIYQISITGPFDSDDAGDTPSRRKIFTEFPLGSNGEEASARTILSNLAMRAFRRPVSSSDLQKPLAFFREGAAKGGFEAGIEKALNSILVSPEFLFRIEREPRDLPSGQAYPISDLELASRLSFFLWSSLPDLELLNSAIAEQLSKPAQFEKQVRRMLRDPRASNLVENFASQWLHLRNLDSITPDLRLFPDFDDNLRQAFRKETTLFIQSIIQEDQSVLNLLRASYTYLNERLAHHYSIPGVFGSRFRKVLLNPEDRRGGLLRQGSVLTVTSYATRTSPVIRGNWVLENIIGTPPPPPPPDVPSLEENKVDASLSMRDRLAAHRANPACASCHNLMDPVGFSLENFDAVGRWLEFENGSPIDVAGGLPDGRVFDGVANLEQGLLERPELFVNTLTKKLLTFALGRGVEAHDAPAIRKIVREAQQDDYKFSSLILGITKSMPFRMRTKSIANERE